MNTSSEHHFLTVQAFLLWANNFKQEDIKELCEQSDEFNHAWHHVIVPRCESKGHIRWEILVEVVWSECSTPTFQKVCDLAVSRYFTEVENNWNNNKYLWDKKS